jgi:excisionase family DNA binding protein
MGADTANTEPWVTAEQVAAHLGVVKDTIYRWRERRGLPAHQIGRLWKFKLSEVDHWVRAGGADESIDPDPSLLGQQQ